MDGDTLRRPPIANLDVRNEAFVFATIRIHRGGGADSG